MSLLPFKFHAQPLLPLPSTSLNYLAPSCFTILITVKPQPCGNPGSQVVLVAKNPPANAGWRRKATHSSVLAWRILWTKEPGGLPSIGSHRVGHDRRDLACMHALEKEMATHSSVLAWRIPETEEPGGLQSMGLHRVGHDWSDLAAPANAGDIRDTGLSSSLGRSPGGGNGNPLQYSCLENPMDRGIPWTAGLPVHRVAKSWKRLRWLNMHACGNPDRLRLCHYNLSL